jgi:hypothetical protein
MLAFDENIKVDISYKDLRDTPSNLNQSKAPLELTPTAANRIRVRVRSTDISKNNLQANLKSIVRPFWTKSQTRIGTPKKNINRSNTPTRLKEEESSGASFIIRKQSHDKFKEFSKASFSSMLKTAEVSKAVNEQASSCFLSTKAACDFILIRITEVSRLIDNKVFLKMFTRELNVRIMEIVERKKDERAQNEIQKLEYKFGKKVALLYDKSKRFTCIENAQLWKHASVILQRTFRKAFTQYELVKLQRSFTYCNELLKTSPDRLESLFDVPPLSLGNALYEEKSELNKIKNIITLKMYIYLTDSMADSLLIHVSNNIRSLLSNIKRIQLDKSEQNRVKNSLLDLVSIMNFDYKRHPLSQLGQSTGQKQQILEIVRKEFHKRIDFQLVNIFLAFAFFKYYSTIRNQEKGYTIFVNSYEVNKTAINDYLVCHSKYFCLRDQLHFYLEERDRREPERPDFRGKNFVQFLKELNKLESRLPYVYEFISQKYRKLLTVDEIKTMLKEVGEAALSLGDFARGGKIIQTYLFVLDAIDRVEMHRMIQVTSEKDDRVKAMLSLSRKYMKYNNRLARVCWETKDYVKGLTFIMNNIFIFYNSLRLINQYDPNSKPTKKPNEVLLMDYETQKQAEGVKKYYRIKLIAFIEEWKLSVQYHSKIWGVVGAAPTHFKQSFFLACGDAISSTEDLPFYTSTTFNEFALRYTNLPSILDRGYDSKIKRAEDDLTLQKHEKTLEMEYYFPTYMGDFDLHLIDNKILEIIYMNEKNKQIMLERGASFLLQNGKGSRAETESHKSKVIKKLMKWEVLVYFQLNFESERFSNELFRHVLKSWFQVNNVSKATFAQKVEFILEDMSAQMRDRVKGAFTTFSLKFRQFLKKRREIAAKLKLRKFFKYADKFVHDSKLRKNQEIVNHIRVVESRPITPVKIRASRFKRERQNQIEKIMLNGHLHNFNQWFTNVDLTDRKKRRGSAAEDPDTVHDHLNCLINHRKFFEVDLLRSIKESKKKALQIKRSRTKVFISDEFQQMFNDFIQSQIDGPLMAGTGQTLQILSSLKELQQRKYNIDWVDELGAHLSYKSSVVIDNLQISFRGMLKSPQSKFEIPLQFDLKFSMDLFLFLESFMLSTKYSFTTIWPVVFDQIKKVYLDGLYNLNKDQISSLPYALMRDLVKFGQRQGFGFSLQYTTYDPPVSSIFREHNYLDNYKKRDIHALQIVINNIQVFMRMAQLLVKQRPTGRTILSVIDCSTFIDLLQNNKINLSLWVFQRLLATKSYLENHSYHRRWLRGFFDTVVQQPQELAKDISDFLSAFSVLLDFSKVDSSTKANRSSNIIFSRRIRTKLVSTATMDLKICLIIKMHELERLIEIFNELHLQGLALKMSPSEFQSYTVYLLMALFDRIVDFELTWHSFVFDKAKQYKQKEEKTESQFLKMISMDSTSSASKPKKQSLSFLQLYYLQKNSGENPYDCSEDSWDFDLRALKRTILDNVSNGFLCLYDLDEVFDTQSSSLLLLFKSVMLDPFNCKYLKRMIKRLLKVSKSVLIAASVELTTVERLTQDLERNKKCRQKWTLFGLDGDELAAAINTQEKLLSSKFRKRIDRGRNEGTIYGLNNSKHVSLANLLIKDSAKSIKYSSQISLLPSKMVSQYFESRASLMPKTTIKITKKNVPVESLFSKNFEEIVKSQKSQWRANLKKAKKISEVVDPKDTDVDLRKVVFSNTQKSPEIMLNEYLNYISKDLVHLVKSRESETAYYLRFKKFQAKLKRDWQNGLGTDSGKIFEEFARGSKTSSDSKEMEVTVRKLYAYDRRIDNDSAKVFNLIMNFKYTEEMVYFAVASVKVLLNFPRFGLNIKIHISDASHLLVILRILKLSSQELQYRCFTAAFGLNKFGYFLSNQLKSLRRTMLESSQITEKQNFVGVAKQGIQLSQ